MQPLLNIAKRAAREAGRVMLRHIDQLDSLTVETKAKNDYVSEVDRGAEAVIIDVIRKAYPNHHIIAEESGESGERPDPGRGAQYSWVIDPLDGTTNYLRGIPHFAVSIAVLRNGRPSAGVVYDPVKEELFSAASGNGAFLNDRRLRVRPKIGLSGAMLATGFPFRIERLREPYMKMFTDLLYQTGDMRRAGTASLDLAYVAAGRLDGYWELGLQPWDIAAGAVIAQEAGALVGDFGGGHDYLKSGHIIAAAPKVFPAILKTVRPYAKGL